MTFLLFAVAVVAGHTYRVYIYENQLNDFHLADTFPNMLPVPLVTSE
jgi:hypothetical protein